MARSTEDSTSRPASQVPFLSGYPQRRGFHEQLITATVRAEILRRFEEKLEENPDLTKKGFAMEVAQEYGVAASSVRRVLSKQ